MKIRIILKRIMFLCVLVLSVSCSEAAFPRKKNLRKNSPIYYISSPFFNSRPTMNGLSSYSSQIFKHHIVTSLFSSPPKYSPSKQSQFTTSYLPSSLSSPSVSKYKPSTASAKTASVYKLPIKFMSNAKPIEVVKGIPNKAATKTMAMKSNNEVVDINSQQTIKRKQQQHHQQAKQQQSIVKNSLKQESKSRKKLASKLIYMPLKYTSNGKITKVKLNSLSKKSY